MEEEYHWNLARNMFPDMQWSTAGPSTPRASRVMDTTQSVTNTQQQQQQQQWQPLQQQWQPSQTPLPTSQSSTTVPKQPASVPASQGNEAAFRKWLLDNGVNDISAETVIRNGFTSQADFKLMKKEDVDIMRIFPLAQRRRLEFLIERGTCGEQSSNSQGATAPEDQGQGVPIAALMRLLTATKNPEQTQQPSAAISSGAAVNNDQGNFPLFTSYTKVKHLDIVDYLRQYEAPSEQILMGSDGDQQVVLRSGSAKPKLEQVTPLQWMGASIRIMRELITKGSLKVTDCDSYLSYMEKLSDFASKYTWPSILQYDREYRRWQAQCECRWGSDNIHLAGIHLDVRSRQPPKQVNTQPSGPQQTRRQQPKLGQPRPAQHDPICRQYNLLKCTFGAACKYVHKCLAPGCDGQHPISEHKTADDKSKNGL